MRTLEVLLRTKLPGHKLDHARAYLPKIVRALYTERLSLIDRMLLDPQKWLRQKLSFRERAALWAMHSRLREELQRAYERGEAVKEPPAPVDPRDRVDAN
jgi:uncharacterized protein (DUF2267 family)